MVVLGHAEQVGDDEHRERLRVPVDELALAAVEELVDLAIGEPPHELLVLVQALRRDQAHEQPAVRGVVGGSNDGSWSLNGSSSRCCSMTR